MSPHDIYLLSPEISLAAVAFMVVIADMVNGPKRLVTGTAVIGLAIPLLFTVLLWGEVSDWWSLLDPQIGEQVGYSLPALYGTLAVDRFALFFKFLFIGSVGLVLLSSYGYVERFAERRSEFHVLIMLSAVGMMLMAAGTELITLYVALELATLPLVALAAFGGDRRSSEAGLKYLVLGAIASAVLLYGMTLTFAFTGSTNLESMALVIGQAAAGTTGDFGGPLLAVGIVLLVAGFGFKIAAVPFHGWVPDVYEGSPLPVTAFLSVASKAAGFAVIIRVFVTAFESLEVDWSLLFAVIAAVSMTIGNLVAIAQTNVKRMLAYSTIAHAGYMLVGLAAVASRTIDGVSIGSETLLFYLGGYAVTNLAAFFAIMAIMERTRSELIESFAGMSQRAPWLALALSVALLSLTGIPPTVGFMAKLFVFGAAIKADLAWLVAIGAVNSVISAYFYLRVIRVMYLAEPKDDAKAPRVLSLDVSVAITAVAVIVLGVWPQGLLEMANRAVERIF
jgi:NADH-quinone oxidoreductase subunit N